MTKKLTPAQRARRQRKQERRWAFITQAASEFESRPEAERQRLTARRQRRDACALSWEEQVEAARQRLRASIERLKQRKAYREQQETARALRAAKRDKGETVPAWRAAKDAPRRVAKLEQRKAYRGPRIFRSMPSGTRFSLGLMLPDGTVIPPKTAPAPIETTRGLEPAQEREARKVANRAARHAAALGVSTATGNANPSEGDTL